MEDALSDVRAMTLNPIASSCFIHLQTIGTRSLADKKRCWNLIIRKLKAAEQTTNNENKHKSGNMGLGFSSLRKLKFKKLVVYVA